MPITRLLRSESVRLAAVTAALFVMVTATLVAVVLWIVADTQRAALMQENDDDIASVMAGFRQEGLGEAKEVVRQRIGDFLDAGSVKVPIYMRIQGRDDQHSLGNLPHLPEAGGTVDLKLSSQEGQVVVGDARSGTKGHIITVSGRGLRLDDSYYLFVGRDTSPLVKTRARILKAFLWVMLASVGAAAVGGVMLARRLMRRVDRITTTCEAIITGRFNERIVASGAGSEWDRLARAINEMLNRISSLLENLQQVSSDIAHDLRTPLTRMRHRLENARNTPLSQLNTHATLDRAIEDIDQILALFSALLRISQVESGSRAAAFRRVNLSEMLENLYAIYRPVAEDSHRSLEHAVSDKIEIQGDAELLFQMASNLIENAIHHTSAGSRILLRIRQLKGHVLLEVADSGEGIPDHELPKVTRRFYRLESSRSSPGHGLGLSLVNAIAELHGATLSLANTFPGFVALVDFDLNMRPPVIAID